MCLQQTDIHINLVKFAPSVLAKLEHKTDSKGKPIWHQLRPNNNRKIQPGPVVILDHRPVNQQRNYCR